MKSSTMNQSSQFNADELQDRVQRAASRIRGEYAAMKAALEQARFEIACLRNGMHRQRSKQDEINQVPVAALRRQVAYQLHPDRGGNAEVMTKINALFDLIESLQEEPEYDLAA